jgi:hypothetical protein
VTGQRQTAVRPRYGRLAAAGSAFLVTLTSLLGGLGVLPSFADSPHSSGAIRPTAARLQVTQPRADAELTPSSTRRRSVDAAPSGSAPADSGSGRRVVFSQSLQRVWLVGAHDALRRTYLVSGSTSDNLHPGTYQVYSRSMHAIGVDDSGTMRYFVRFTRGDTGAAIGFHDIPVADGHRTQSASQLGTPQSHGCIRQKTVDAKALWRFAPLGTTVVVIA